MGDSTVERSVEEMENRILESKPHLRRTRRDSRMKGGNTETEIMLLQKTMGKNI